MSSDCASRAPRASHGGARVVLFKQEKHPHDDYRSQLEAQGHTVHFLPVLRMEFDSMAIVRLAAMLRAVHRSRVPRQHILLTSPRTGEALGRALDLVALPDASRYIRQHVRVHALGFATTETLRRLGVPFVDASAPIKDARGLGEHFLSTHHAPQDPPPWFLCGTSRRDTLPRMLREHGVPYLELALYASVSLDAAEVRGQAQAVLSRPHGPSHTPVAVLFSPKGAQAASKALGLFRVVVCIGQTTAGAVDGEGRRVGVCDTPDATGVLACLRQHRDRGDASGPR